MPNEQVILARILSPGGCGSDGTIDLFDILFVLDAFEGKSPLGCAPELADLVGDDPCSSPDGVVDLSDILEVLDQFAGR